MCNQRRQLPYPYHADALAAKLPAARLPGPTNPRTAASVTPLTLKPLLPAGMMAPSPPAPFSAPPPASFPMASAPQQAANGPASSGLAPAAQHGIPAPTPRPHSTPVALQPSMPPPPASLLGLSSVPALGMRSMGMPAFPQPPQTFPQPPSSGAQVSAVHTYTLQRLKRSHRLPPGMCMQQPDTSSLGASRAPRS